MAPKSNASRASKPCAAPGGDEAELVLVAAAPAAAAHPRAGRGGGGRGRVEGLAREDRTHEHLGHFDGQH